MTGARGAREELIAAVCALPVRPAYFSARLKSVMSAWRLQLKRSGYGARDMLHKQLLALGAGVETLSPTEVRRVLSDYKVQRIHGAPPSPLQAQPSMPSADETGFAADVCAVEHAPLDTLPARMLEAMAGWVIWSDTREVNDTVLRLLHELLALRQTHPQGLAVEDIRRALTQLRVKVSPHPRINRTLEAIQFVPRVPLAARKPKPVPAEPAGPFGPEIVLGAREQRIQELEAEIAGLLRPTRFVLTGTTNYGLATEIRDWLDAYVLYGGRGVATLHLLVRAADRREAEFIAAEHLEPGYTITTELDALDWVFNVPRLAGPAK